MFELVAKLSTFILSIVLFAFAFIFFRDGDVLMSLGCAVFGIVCAAAAVGG